MFMIRAPFRRAIGTDFASARWSGSLVVVADTISNGCQSALRRNTALVFKGRTSMAYGVICRFMAPCRSGPDRRSGSSRDDPCETQEVAPGFLHFWLAQPAAPAATLGAD